MAEPADFPDELRADAAALGSHPYTCDLLERAAAEIERLHAYQNETAIAWTKLTESQEEEIAKLTERCAAYKGQVESGAIEIGRLQEAKRRALAVADERSLENVRLRRGRLPSSCARAQMPSGGLRSTVTPTLP